MGRSSGELRLPLLPQRLCLSRRSRAAQKKDPGVRFHFGEIIETASPVAKGEARHMQMWQGVIQQGGEQGSQGRGAPGLQGPGEAVLLLPGSKAPDPEGNT